MRVTGGQVFDLEQGFVTRDVCTNGALLSAASGDSQTLDAAGCYVIPGLVDVHFHGCVGEDFSDATPDGLQRMADYELSQGVTYICPAGMTLLEPELTAICKNAAAHRSKNAGGAELVGLHLEGPFLSMAKKGAQNGDFLHAPDVAMLRRLQEAAEGCVKLVTVAPEEPGGLDFVKAATADGIHVSVGHTTADYDTASAAFAAGADHATHLYNGMPPLHHRDPAVIGAASDASHVMPELICDGVHIHGSVVRLTFQLFGKERVILISDSLRATGMPDGQYPFGGQEIEVHGNRATIVGHPETLAGSVTSLMGCLRQAVAFGIPLEDAVRACSYNPARSIGIEGRTGSLEEGKEASFVLLDQDTLAIRAIVFKGALVQQ
ncbi:N-acetylglucosamine-6-phosphate deacetylase [Pseudoflavonifractor phocaeensis]|uniref:N-acetylglucosamine-6-phosphate deacetylase n=1 Tax=Pseudoflavonifractor phocaeensis TaxID=1870988 RepID=UPI001F47504E|nr:N-acetylglucosamine-6-phosphate deacetylase [Pseudoflavonifractor phocaeensis]MCF2595569.1 N-acetylglucosamine-6-phosphate deacetylase [Pseudoflavonifractor phocaeensis]